MLRRLLRLAEGAHLVEAVLANAEDVGPAGAAEAVLGDQIGRAHV